MAEKYITLNKDGKDYRAIANMMTKAGYPCLLYTSDAADEAYDV